MEGRVTRTRHYEIAGGHTYASASELDSETAVWTTETQYNTRGLVEWSEDRFGVRTCNVYDARGNVIETRTQATDEGANPGWLVSRTLYDEKGRVEFTTDTYFVLAADYPASADVPWRGTRSVYDHFDRVIRTEQHDGVIIELVDDTAHAGQQTTTLPDGFVWDTAGTKISESQTFYDQLGRVEYTLDEFGTRTEFVYDPVGREIESRYQSKDASGAIQWIATRTVYDLLGRPVVTSDPFIQETDGTMPAWYGTSTTYDALGRAEKTERLEGLVIDISDPANVTSTASGVVWSTKTVYNTLGQVIQSIGRHAPDEAGPVTEYLYDSLGRQTAVIQPLVVDPDTGLPVYVDGQGRGLRHMAQTLYGADGRTQSSVENLWAVVDGDGELLYNGDDIVTANDADPGTIADNPHTTSYQYDAQGHVIRTTYTDDSFVSQSYDDFGRLWKQGYQTEAGGTPLEKEFAYDDYGRLTSVTLPAVFDPLTSQTVHPVYEYGYDAQGNQRLIHDPLNHETWFTYDAQGRETSRTLPIGVATTGDPDDFIERKFYDEQGRLDYEVSFEGRVTAYIYDESVGASGRLAEKRFYETITLYDEGDGTPGEIWTYTYDAFGRVYQISQAVDGVVRTTTTLYDVEGRITQIALDEGTINYAYDPVTGLRRRMFTGSQADPIEDVHYTFDTLGRLATVEVYERNNVVLDADDQEPGDQPETTRYEYDLLGNLRRERKANGVVADHVYDSLNRLDVLTEFKDNNGDGDYDAGVDAILAQFDYDLAADGKRIHVTEHFDHDANPSTELESIGIDWFYDSLGRMTREVYDSYDDTLDFAADYVMDLVGNRRAKFTDTDPSAADLASCRQRDVNGRPVNEILHDEAVESIYDANDRLLTESVNTDGEPGAERVTTYGYDGTQETLREVRADAVLQSKSEFTYDLQGRMVTVKVTSYTDGTPSRVELSTYDYNASGIRVSALVETDTNADGTYDTSTKTEYLNDPHNETGYSQVLAETTTNVATGDVEKRAIYTLGHDRLTQTTTSYSGGVAQSSETLSFGQDGHGSTRVLFDMAGAIATVTGARQLFHYDAYGNAVGFNPGEAATAFLYNCEQRDSTGLIHLRRRDYRPETGTFTTLDPPHTVNLQDPQSLHKYLYCKADSVNAVDPSGHFGVWGGLGVAGAAYFLTSLIAKMAIWTIDIADALAEALGPAAPGTVWAPGGLAGPMGYVRPPSPDPFTVRAQARLDYIHRLREQLIGAGNDIIIWGNTRGYSGGGASPLTPEEWTALRRALQYAQHYDDYGRDVRLWDFSSVNIPTWPGISLDQEVFLGDDDAVSLMILVHEPMHDLFYPYSPRDAIGHDLINRIVGPYSFFSAGCIRIFSEFWQGRKSGIIAGGWDSQEAEEFAMQR